MTRNDERLVGGEFEIAADIHIVGAIRVNQRSLSQL